MRPRWEICRSWVLSQTQCKSGYFESTALNQCWFSVLIFFQQVKSTLIRCVLNVECPLDQSVDIILCVLLQSTLFTTSVILICTHQRWVYQAWISKQHINTQLHPIVVYNLVTSKVGQHHDEIIRQLMEWSIARYAGSQSVSLQILRELFLWSHRIIIQTYWGSENIQMQTAFSFVMLASSLDLWWVSLALDFFSLLVS